MRPYYDDGSVMIYHGDCREMLPHVGEFAAVVTDPPYGIRDDTDRRRFGDPTNRVWARIVGDDEAFNPHPWIDRPCVLFGANYYSRLLPVGKWVVWNKRDAMATNMLLADAELIWHNCAGRPVQVFNWFWNGAFRKGESGPGNPTPTVHPSQKPVALMRWLLSELIPPEAVILDPYMGSGTTLLAAKSLGRRAVGVEIEGRYCEAAVQRLGQEVLDLEAA